MSVVRVSKESNFTIIRNETIRDTRLPLDSMGLLCRLLSNHDKWEIRFEALKFHLKIGRDHLRRMLKDLQRTGYLQRKRIRKANGNFDWLCIIYEVPQTSTIDELPVHGSTTSDTAADGIPGDIKSTSKKTTKQKETTTTTVAGSSQNTECDEQLVLPRGLTQSEREKAVEMLDGCGKSGQEILDVLQATINVGGIKKSRLSYLSALIKRYNDGLFDATPGLQIAEKRKLKANAKPPLYMSTEEVLKLHAQMKNR